MEKKLVKKSGAPYYLQLKNILKDLIRSGDLKEGRIATDDEGRSSHPRIWAGGDCRFGGRDLTVEAVEHGKRSAVSIDLALRGRGAATARQPNAEKSHG